MTKFRKWSRKEDAPGETLATHASNDASTEEVTETDPVQPNSSGSETPDKPKSTLPTQGLGKSKFYAEQELHFQLVAVLHAKDEEPFKLTWYEQESSTDSGLFIYYLKIKTLKQKLPFSFICTAGPPTPIMSQCLAQTPAPSMVQGAAGEPKRHEACPADRDIALHCLHGETHLCQGLVLSSLTHAHRLWHRS